MKLRASYVLVVIAALLAVAVIGCGSGNGDGAGSASPGAGSGTSERATPADSSTLTAIAKGQILDGGMTPVRGVVVKSQDAESLYFIAMEFSSTGADNAIGVWATSDLQGGTQIWAVDKVARDSTQWPRSGTSEKQRYTMSSEGAQEARDALR
ncbi:MAG: hypothetical protein WCP98_04670 [Actinomycetes bacterium]